MPNIKDDDRVTIFIDLDGTLVRHNYSPDLIMEMILPGYQYLIENRDKFYLVLTTARSEELASSAIAMLKGAGLIFDVILYDLPTGSRHLINDYKDEFKPKAFVYNVLRNEGIEKPMEQICLSIMYKLY